MIPLQYLCKNMINTTALLRTVIICPTKVYLKPLQAFPITSATVYSFMTGHKTFIVKNHSTR